MAFPKKKYWIEAGDIKTKLPKQHDTGMFRSLDEIVWDILKCCGWDCCNQEAVGGGEESALTFENGLTNTAGIVKLGGVLTDSVTTVSGDNKTLTVDIVKNSNSSVTSFNPGGVTSTITRGGTQTIRHDTTPDGLTLRSTLGVPAKLAINTISSTSVLHVVGLVEYADNATAAGAGLTVGAFYHTAGVLKVVI